MQGDQLLVFGADNIFYKIRETNIPAIDLTTLNKVIKKNVNMVAKSKVSKLLVLSRKRGSTKTLSVTSMEAILGHRSPPHVWFENSGARVSI